MSGNLRRRLVVQNEYIVSTEKKELCVPNILTISKIKLILIYSCIFQPFLTEILAMASPKSASVSELFLVITFFF